MPSGSPEELVAELHRRQREMYAGGPVEPVAELLAPDIVWHVPGRSPIAGDHRGRDAVLAYFRRRRELASSTFVMHPKGVLADGDAVAPAAWSYRPDSTVLRLQPPARTRTITVLRRCG